MGSQSYLARFPFFPWLIAVSLFVGWFVPDFYEWTGSDQSRPSPLIWQTALCLIVGILIVWAVLPWLPIADAVPVVERPVRVRFTIRTMLLITAVVAFVIAVATKFPLVVSRGLCAIAICYVVSFWSRFRHLRWQTTALLACMWLPFVWILAWPEFRYDFRPILEILWSVAGLPAFLPAAAIGRLWGQGQDDMMWLAMLLSAAEMTVGVWIICLGPRRTIAYLVLVLLMSTIGSFGLNALVRA